LTATFIFIMSEAMLPALSDAERAALELEQLMSQSPGTSEAGDDFGGHRVSSPTPGELDDDFPAGVIDRTVAAVPDGNSAASAHRLVRQHKLTPYQRTEADQFIKVLLLFPCD
jgi:hypothetical protein